MAGCRAHFLSLLENDFVGAFCAFGADFMPFRGRILEENLFKDFAPDIAKCVFMDQIHSNKVEIYQGGAHRLVCDGLVCAQKGVALCVLSADCLPLLLWHKKGVVAALHSGRAGCFENILKEAFLLLQKHFQDLDASNFKLIIAPSICAQNYEIAGEVLEHAKRHFAPFLHANKLDLKALVKAQAKALGIEDIIDCGICSYEDERFFSYRRDHTGERFASVIYLRA